MLEQAHSFELLEVVGRGGFGTVYRARFLGEGGFAKEVALKVLHHELEANDVVAGRLRDEARVLGLLRHRAIVQVDRLVQMDGRWAIVMEYVEGQSLAQILHQGPIPPAAALEIVGEVAAALHAAWHRRGPSGQPLHLVHRDIKPSNVQITPHGEVKLLDFGVARAEFSAREAATRSMSLGTLGYMAPERLDGRDDGPEGDIYALGVLLHECLVGVNFGRTSARRERHDPKVREAAAQLTEIPGVNTALRELVEAMLTWSPDARPSAGDVEMSCTYLRSGLEGESLRTWAERRVGAVRASAVAVAEVPTSRPEDDETVLTARLPPVAQQGAEIAGLQGMVVTPSAPPSPSSRAPAPPRREPTRRRGLLAWALVGLSTVGGIGLMLGVVVTSGLSGAETDAQRDPPLVVSATAQAQFPTPVLPPPVVTPGAHLVDTAEPPEAPAAPTDPENTSAGPTGHTPTTQSSGTSQPRHGTDTTTLTTTGPVAAAGPDGPPPSGSSDPCCDDAAADRVHCAVVINPDPDNPWGLIPNKRCSQRQQRCVPCP